MLYSGDLSLWNILTELTKNNSREGYIQNSSVVERKKVRENLLGLVVVKSGRFYLPDACVYILNVLPQPHEYYFKMANDLLLKPE